MILNILPIVSESHEKTKMNNECILLTTIVYGYQFVLCYRARLYCNNCINAPQSGGTFLNHHEQKHTKVIFIIGSSNVCLHVKAAVLSPGVGKWFPYNVMDVKLRLQGKNALFCIFSIKTEAWIR